MVDEPAAGGWSGVAPPAVTSTSAKAGWALGLAVASWFLCPVVGAVAALVLGALAKTEIAASGGRLTGAGMATVAQVVSVVHLGLLVIAGAVFVVLSSAFEGSAALWAG